MTRDELQELLQQEGVKERAYSLSGGYHEDRYCLEESYGRWTVYYAERGNRREERSFSSEDDACADLLQRILRDTTTRVSRKQFPLPPLE